MSVEESPEIPDQNYTITHPDVPRRVLFEGSLKSAMEYMRNHFPRPHSDGNGLIYSAQLNHPNGDVQTFHTDDDNGNDGWSKLDKPSVEPPVAPAVPVSDAPAPLFP